MNTEIINFVKYPLNRPDCTEYKILVAELNKKLTDDGIINLKNFILPDALAQFNSEVDARIHQAYHCIHGANSYFKNFPGEVPAGSVSTESYTLGRDKLSNTKINTLYEWPQLRRFVADILNENEVYINADPTNALFSTNIQRRLQGRLAFRHNEIYHYYQFTNIRCWWNI